MVDPKLVMQARRLLNQARLIPEASASNMSPLSNGHADSKMPPGLTFTALGNLRASEISSLELYGNAFNRAIANDSNADLAFAIDWCERDLRALTHSSAHQGESPVERRERVLKQYEGEQAGVVARAELVSVTLVRKWRSDDGREPRLGRKVDAAASEPDGSSSRRRRSA